MKWSEKELKYLKENYPKEIHIKEMSKRLNRSIKSIRHKAAREGLSKKITPHNKPKEKFYRNKIDKKYYEKNKEEIYRKKRERLKNRKKELVKLLGGKCSICGYNKCINALDFHHKNKDNKEGNLAHIIKDSSKENSLKEIKKCILVCANCHREIHTGA